MARQGKVGRSSLTGDTPAGRGRRAGNEPGYASEYRNREGVDGEVAHPEGQRGSRREELPELQRGLLLGGDEGAQARLVRGARGGDLPPSTVKLASEDIRFDHRQARTLPGQE